MVLTPQDLQAIKELVTANNEVLLEQVDVMIDKKLEQRNRDIAQIINQALSTVDDVYATKAELAEVRQVAQLERQLALS
jgi:DNA-binding transcriptional regulator GbsR (MarR family)